MSPQLFVVHRSSVVIHLFNKRPEKWNAFEQQFMIMFET